MNQRFVKLFGILFLASLVILSGCGMNSDKPVSNSAAGEKSAGEEPVTIATSFYPMYVLALNVTKDIPNTKVINMTKPITGCLHDYALTPEDMKNLEKAKFLIINGGGMESFLDKVLSQMPDLKIIDSSQGIPLLKGEGEVGDNPHLWVSITNAIQQVKNIGDQLAALDPGNAAQYQENARDYIKKLEAFREKMHQELDGITDRNIITFHEAFPYFAKEFNLNIIGVIEREPGSEPSAKELAETIEKVKRLKVKALFAEPQYPAKMIDTIVKETGARVYYLDPVVTGPMEADAYLNIMETNLQTLKEALK